MPIRGYSLSTLVVQGVIFSVVVILLRLAWAFPGARIAWMLRTWLQHQTEKPPRAREVFVVGWTGMRGVISLAAALSLPAVLSDGSPFPQRNLIVFLAFCVILVTLVLQGLTLPAVVRVLGLAGAGGPNCEEQEARRIVMEAAVLHLNEAKKRDAGTSAAIYEELTRQYQRRLDSMGTGGGSHYVELWLEALRVERDTAIRLRDEGRINDEVLRRIERELI